jgi:hypothetical protein
MDISFLLGRRTDKGGLRVFASLLVGGNPALAADVNVKNSVENLIQFRQMKTKTVL